MARAQVHVASSLLLLALASPAIAAVNITVITQSGENVVVTDPQGHTAPPYDIAFRVGPSDGTQNSVSSPVVRVQATNGEVINSITVEIDLPITGSRVNLLVNGTGAGLSGVGSISRDDAESLGGELWVQSIVAIDSVFGTIDAHRVLHVQTTSDSSDGDISANITEGGSNISTSSEVVIDAEADITGDLTLKTPVDDIHAAGHVGDPLDPITITCDREVDSIEAGLDVGAVITINAASGTGLIRRMSAYCFVGELTAEGIENASGGGIFLNTDLQADVTLNSAVLERPIIIGWEFADGFTIWLKAEDGLGEGAQISINNNDDAMALAWLGSVKVGTSSPVTITADPDYTNTAVSLGGGSIGLAPFYLHDESCAPENGGDVVLYAHSPASTEIPPPCEEQNPVVKLRFYGPVVKDSGAASDEVIKVEKFLGGSSWDDVTDEFDAAVAGDPHDRVVVVTPDTNWELGTYRLTGYEDGGMKNLRCRNVGGELYGPEVQDFTYLVTFIDGCEEWLLGIFDVNDDDDLTYEGDIGAWTGAPVDFTGDNIADEDDLEALLTAIGQFNE